MNDSGFIAVAKRLPGIPDVYEVFTGNNEYPDIFEVYFDGFKFEWMDLAITHWRCKCEG